MRQPDSRLRRRTTPRWATPLKVMALPVVVLLFAAGYAQSAGSKTAAVARVAPGELPATAVVVPTETGSGSEPATLPVVQPTATPEAPDPGPPSIAGPRVTRMPDPPATATHTPLPTATHTATPTPLLPTPDGSTRIVRVPILMYHHVEVPPADAGEIRRDLSVSPANFEQQLHYLKQEGYVSLSLLDLALHLTRGEPLPDKPVILTFDDGYRDNYTNAFPLLERYGFAATFFLVTAPVDAGNPDFLSWDQVQEMHRAGMEFEPHSLDHPDMRDRATEFLVYQVLASKGAIEERTGEACRFFAYPSGRYDQHVIDVLRSADFWGAVLTEQGATHRTDGLFELKRVRVQAGDSLDAFAVKVAMVW